MRGAGCLAFVVVAALGCGGGSRSTANQDASLVDVATTDIAGWFAVTSYETGDCGMTAPSSLGSPYVWVEFQLSRYVVHACDGTSETDCTGTYFYDFTQPIENGWRAEGGTAFYSAGCTLTIERTDLTVIEGDLRATSLKYQQVSATLAEAQCTLDAARALTSPCTYETDLTATRM